MVHSSRSDGDKMLGDMAEGSADFDDQDERYGEYDEEEGWSGSGHSELNANDFDDKPLIILLLFSSPRWAGTAFCGARIARSAANQQERRANQCFEHAANLAHVSNSSSVIGYCDFV